MVLAKLILANIDKGKTKIQRKVVLVLSEFASKHKGEMWRESSPGIQTALQARGGLLEKGWQQLSRPTETQRVQGWGAEG